MFHQEQTDDGSDEEGWVNIRKGEAYNNDSKTAKASKETQAASNQSAQTGQNVQCPSSTGSAGQLGTAPPKTVTESGTGHTFSCYLEDGTLHSFVIDPRKDGEGQTFEWGDTTGTVTMKNQEDGVYQGTWKLRDGHSGDFWHWADRTSATLVRFPGGGWQSWIAKDDGTDLRITVNSEAQSRLQNQWRLELHVEDESPAARLWVNRS